MDGTGRTDGQDDFLRISVQQQAYDAFHALPDGMLSYAAMLAYLSGLMRSTHGLRAMLRTSSEILALDDTHATALLSLIREYGYALHIPRDSSYAARVVAREAQAHPRRPDQKP